MRRATIADGYAILTLIRDLAEYERELDAVEATVETLAATLFGTQPTAFCDLVEVDGEVVGMAIWFLNFSTWQAKYGIYLEDLFVQPSHRGQGFGHSLLKHLAQTCVENGYGRFQWSVLDWNQPAIDFYTQLGAEAMDEWTVYRVSGEALTQLANS
ncbi:MAG: GNAT family N-acetyltransferase [Actinobacteria bacterium]|nr:GNAT family N-acetyltransferase [Actinomycetota bacterium]